MTEPLIPGGYSFLLTSSTDVKTFTPEDFTDEQRQIAATTQAFVNEELLPVMERMETQDFPLVVEMMRRCAELGLFLVDVPEEYGGLALDKATSMLIAEKLGPSGSFAITCTGQTGIGTLPLIYYGSAEQKERYLSRLSSGEWIGAYCLTEPDCGSDPLSARTTAVLSPDKQSYLLNGVKQFITNAAFADLFTVFAKIDGEHFSAFLVERGTPGLSIGAEEKKMGLKGTSTAQVVLDNVRIPAGNLLGDPGKGHKIAFNVLNVGRLKLAATTTGAAKGAFAEGCRYSAERKQFGRHLSQFGAIREKLADMAAEIFAAESLLYRVCGLLDERIAVMAPDGSGDLGAYQKAIEEYAGECAMAKVFCTRALALVTDESLQIHGGYGYMMDYPIERYYRDERINRIFEGTNEINRLLIPTLLLRRVDGGDVPLGEAIQSARPKLTTGDADRYEDTHFPTENELLAKLKRVCLHFVGQKPSQSVQEVQVSLADMLIALFVIESCVLRADKVYAQSTERKRLLLEAAVRTAVFANLSRFRDAAGRCAAYTLPQHALLEAQLKIAELCGYPVGDLLASKQQLADAAVEASGYPF